MLITSIEDGLRSVWYRIKLTAGNNAGTQFNLLVFIIYFFAAAVAATELCIFDRTPPEIQFLFNAIENVLFKCVDDVACCVCVFFV